MPSNTPTLAPTPPPTPPTPAPTPGGAAPAPKASVCEICSKSNKQKPGSLTFQYTAGVGVNSNQQGTKAGGALTGSFPSSTTVAMNGQTIAAADGASFTVQGGFSAESTVAFGNGQTLFFHTSCSVPLIKGDRYGPLTLLSGTDSAGTTLPCGTPSTGSSSKGSKSERGKKGSGSTAAGSSSLSKGKKGSTAPGGGKNGKKGKKGKKGKEGKKGSSTALGLTATRLSAVAESHPLVAAACGVAAVALALYAVARRG